MDSFSNQPPVADRLELDYEFLRDEITAALKATDSLIEINSDEDVMAARELVAPLKALQGKVDAAFRHEKAPHLEAGRTTDRFFKDLRVHLDSVVALITDEAGAYQTRKLALAREKAASEARTAAMLDERPPEPLKPAAATRVADGGAVAVSGAVRWDFEITDEAALPRELLQPNVAAIRARVAGLKATMDITKAAGAIPGIRVLEKISTTFR